MRATSETAEPDKVPTVYLKDNESLPVTPNRHERRKQAVLARRRRRIEAKWGPAEAQPSDKATII